MKYLTVVLAALALTSCITFNYVWVREDNEIFAAAIAAAVEAAKEESDGEASEESRTE